MKLGAEGARELDRREQRLALAMLAQGWGAPPVGGAGALVQRAASAL
jgi:hypothetical protein